MSWVSLLTGGETAWRDVRQAVIYLELNHSQAKMPFYHYARLIKQSFFFFQILIEIFLKRVPNR